MTSPSLRWPQPHGTALALTVLAVVCLSGCAQTQAVRLRATPDNAIVARLKLMSRGGPELTPRVKQSLRRYALDSVAEKNMAQALAQFESYLEAEPTYDNLFAYAELSYVAGVKAQATDPRAALDLYGASAAYAYRCLFDPQLYHERNPYDPEFRGACDLYNGALESALRLTCRDGRLVPGATHSIETRRNRWQMTVVPRGLRWDPEDFGRVEFASDYEVTGLRNHFRTFGLGVPLIAVRQRHDDESRSERFYPQELSFPVTVFLRLPHVERGGRTPASGEHHALLELYDPLAATDTEVCGARVPLESDLSKPLAHFLQNGNLGELATQGLLRPDATQKQRGIYLTQPFDPHKIPVVFIHGLWSSPVTWMEMLNDLQAQPAIRDRYQFWFYFYPTGQPFWVSAAQFRSDLQEARLQLDPQRSQPALDQMVLVGHSMGGLVAKMQTVRSGDQFWASVSKKPLTELKADPVVRVSLQQTFYFEPSTSIRRLVTIGTPHRGSEFANPATRWIGRHVISLPQQLIETPQKLMQDNPDTFKTVASAGHPTSIDSLAPDSPLLPALLTAPQAPWIRRHNVVGRVSKIDKLSWKPVEPGDGIVAYTSAHLDNVESEVVVDAYHTTIHAHPLTVLEVRRVLLDHLRELDAGSVARLPPVQAASR